MKWWRRTKNADGIQEAEQALQREKRANAEIEAKRPTVDRLETAIT